MSSSIVLMMAIILTCEFVTGNSFEDDESELLLFATPENVGFKTALESSSLTGTSRSSKISDMHIKNGFFASTLLDKWRENTPYSVELKLYNYFHQMLWSVSFNTNETASPSLENWFETDRLLGNFRDVDSDLISLNTSLKNYTLAITAKPYQAIFAIFTPEDKQQFGNDPDSKYVFARNNSQLFDLYTAETRVFSSIGCRPLFDLDEIAMVDLSKSNIGTMTVGVCTEHCWNKGFRMSGLHRPTGNTFSCHCVRQMINDTPMDDVFCPLKCPGDVTQTHSCGAEADNLLAVYEITLSRLAPKFEFDSVEIFRGETEAVTGAGNSGFEQNIQTVVLDKRPVFVNMIKVTTKSPVDANTTGFEIGIQVKGLNGSRYIKYRDKNGQKIFEFDEAYSLDLFLTDSIQIYAINITDGWKTIVYGPAGNYSVAPILAMYGSYNTPPTDSVLTENDMSATSYYEQSTALIETTQPAIYTTPTASYVSNADWNLIAKKTDAIVTSQYDILTSKYDIQPSPTTEYIEHISSSSKTTLHASEKCCFCDCSMYNAYTKWHDDKNGTKNSTKDTEAIISEIKQENIINKTQLSSFRRQKSSASDPRPSSKGLGCCGAVILCIVLACILLIDAADFKQQILLLKTNLQNIIEK